MADSTAETEKKPRSMLLTNILVSSVLGFVCGGLGMAAFTFLPGTSDAGAGDVVQEDLPAAYVPFGEVVVNLGDSRMSRYLRISLLCKWTVSPKRPRLWTSSLTEQSCATG